MLQIIVLHCNSGAAWRVVHAGSMPQAPW